MDKRKWMAVAMSVTVTVKRRLVEFYSLYHIFFKKKDINTILSFLIHSSVHPSIHALILLIFWLCMRKKKKKAQFTFPETDFYIRIAPAQ